MLVRFICGCRHDVDAADIGWWREVGTDREGFLVCVTHNARRVGWRSLPTINGNDSLSDFDFAHMSPLELEKLLVFGKQPHEQVVDVVTTVEDVRDDRDPETLGREVLARRNGHD